jgi:hypothetical protein
MLGLGPMELLILAAGGACCLFTTVLIVLGIVYVVRTAAGQSKPPE